MKYIENVVIGEPLVPPVDLLTDGTAEDSMLEFEKTLFTEERNLARLLVNLGIAKSMNEVRKNRPELMQMLNDIDCFWIKWGKKRLYVIVGE